MPLNSVTRQNLDRILDVFHDLLQQWMMSTTRNKLLYVIVHHRANKTSKLKSTD